ncbi:FliO/MopB family protein [Singulisphaera acidiphila]|uniref:Flagellar biogenesis protein n=1 Tax=Singulisphaera acidiphila (strain ATCC BAA-1392 / DSM 18658 / VKM B-2454 / MOB10) TaxID=886293 RepID=L0DSW8_SINAD|nr:flagellar biosynthetic protein FliO [Singulisphaera acidiphila]AGA31456.1 flagellar biogenesis protein [Singulisphaera acidiphila DSM 18658]
MPSARLRQPIFAGAIVVLGPLASVFLSSQAWADHVAPTAAIHSPSSSASSTGTDRQPFAPRGTSGRRGAKGPEGSSGWWLGTGGIALALALCGGISVASKRYLPTRNGTSSMRVVGRTVLSPKHSVYLLEVGERVLIIGTGGQGAPSLLGELTDTAERDGFLTPQRSGPTVSVPIGPAPSAGRFDRRVGDDE